MKKKIVFTVCTAALLLTGCRADSTMLIEYSDLNVLKSSDILDLVTADTLTPYSDGIAVINYSNSDSSEDDTLSSDEQNTDESHAPQSESETEPDSETESESESETEAESGSETDESGTQTGGNETDDENDTDENSTEPSLKTPGLLVCTTTNEVLFNNLPYKEVAPASLTKLMTALIVMEKANMDDVVTLTSAMNQDMFPGAQVCGFVPGDKITVKELLYSMLVYSGNDAANALAIHVGGDINSFVNMMNEKANLLGAVNTHFSNPSGLDIDNHYSSAYDLYLIFNECLKYDDFKTAICQASYTNHYISKSGQDASITYTSTNLYMNGTYTSPEGITIYGGKTGTTDDAGACLITYAKDSSGNEYISVSLGSKDKPELYSQMNKILAKFQK